MDVTMGAIVLVGDDCDRSVLRLWVGGMVVT